ncbi:MAG TPA: NAD(P)H-dependent glycerol-3-phosphate dehydrogenase [Syntrophorhabdaceae bacterium]|nr:NAD(P)H-dependent glycerol-3-phosphate dehydrogenase [Syntrophorhabdaceae bacterium]HQM81461.1 NAD(P)H-dependent glycerol-3-phosphate dehydrogenase [Syntrophorhabdaceae bacterium]
MKISLIGAGAWGTAFALHLARTGEEVLLWVFEKELFEIAGKTKENAYYLPGFTLPDNVTFTDNIKDIPEFSDDIIFAPPSFALRKTAAMISEDLTGKRLLILTKGIENGTSLFMSGVVEEVALGKAGIASLSGPSFAREVAEGLFTSTVIASKDKGLSLYFQKIIHSNTFRVYTSDDISGVELGGAMKNVMAIGAGIIQGLNLGANTLAAYITRSLAEMKRLGRSFGARETTFMGLSGMGDLLLTSYGKLSRNRLFGMELSQGKNAEDVIRNQKSVVEGYYTVKAAYNLSRKLNVEMPITEELYKIIYEGKNIQASLQDIISREYKEEDQ